MTTAHDEALRVHNAGVAGRRAWTASDAFAIEESHGLLLLASPMHHSRGNAVIRTDDAHTESMEARVAWATARADERKAPLAWWVDADVAPNAARELPPILESHGFEKRSTLRPMHADTGMMDTRIKTVAKFTCPRVTTDDDLATWAQTCAVAYGFDDDDTEAWRAMHATCGYTADRGWRHFLALSGDSVIGCASAFVEDDNVSVSHVTTLPDYRGASVGTASTLKALEQARAEKITHATLYAPARTADLYQRIGFLGVGGLDVYERAGAGG